MLAHGVRAHNCGCLLLRACVKTYKKAKRTFFFCAFRICLTPHNQCRNLLHPFWVNFLLIIESYVPRRTPWTGPAFRFLSLCARFIVERWPNFALGKSDLRICRSSGSLSGGDYGKMVSWEGVVITSESLIIGVVQTACTCRKVRANLVLRFMCAGVR